MREINLYFVTILICLFLLSFLTSSKGFLSISQIENAYANGIKNNIGRDLLPPLNLDNTPLGLWIEFKPSIVDSHVEEKRQLIFKLIDTENNSTQNPKTMEVIILKNNFRNNNITEDLFLNDTFNLRNDSLVLEFNSAKKESGKMGKYNNSMINSKIEADINGTVYVNYPILESGIYHLKIKTNMKNNNGLNGQNFLKFDSYLSLGNILNINNFSQNKNDNLTILSYNDQILKYDYNNNTDEISFEIPFKYNLTRVEEGFIYIHTELKIPKQFKKFFNANSSIIKINDIDFAEISKSSVSIDRFSNSSYLIVHYILDSNSLFKLAKDRTEKGLDNSELILKFSFLAR